tara:strand:- start:2502 stop:3368 length:867 start_codon:yes stop_codon:yes gene_type:complete
MSKSEDSIMIGGVGGSGTRVFAESLLNAGIRSLSDLNSASDHLGSTLLFKRTDIFDDIESGRFEMVWSLLEKAFDGGTPPTKEEKSLLKALANQDRPNHNSRWLRKRKRSLVRDMKSKRDDSRWFVKEPNLHIITPAVLELRDDIRMVMVVRHGVDMVFSGNQQQSNLWGSRFLEEPDLVCDHVSSLRYWCVVHHRILDIANRHPDRIRILSFDQLCQDPEPVLRSLFEFTGIDATDELLRTCSTGVRPPKSIGRRHGEDLSGFSSSDIDFVDEFMERIQCTNKPVNS